MTKITQTSFIVENFDKEVKPYQQQIKKGVIKVISLKTTTVLIHADTFGQMEKYLQGYFRNLLSSPFYKLQEKDINDYTESWDREDKLQSMTTGLNITDRLQAWISVFIRQIYLQPVYYYEAVKKFPDTLPYEGWVYQRYRYLNDKTRFAQNKYTELSQKDYRKYRELLPMEDKEAIREVRKILFFTENLLSKIPHYLYSSPILAAFIQEMFDLKKLYDIIFPNTELPLMNKYFKNAYVSQFNVKYIPFEKDLKNTKLSKPLTFESLFKDNDNAKKVKQILEANHYTIKGKWEANKVLHLNHTGNKNELLAAYRSLKTREATAILKKGKITTQAKLFYQEFGLTVGDGKYISERSLRNEPAPADIKVFDKLFISIK